MKIYANNQDYALIDQYVGTNIWVRAFYFDDLGTPNYDYVNILSRNGDMVTFKSLENAFVSGDAGDEEVWDFPWSDRDIYDVIRNFRNHGSQDCEIYKFSISENSFEIEHPAEILTTSEINEMIDECYDNIIRKFES